jgi:hypothetical protein
VDPATREKFESDLKRLYKKILVCALGVARTTGLYTIRRESIQETADYLLYEAVTRTLEGRRHWDPKRVPDLDYFLQQAMRSIASSDIKAFKRNPNTEQELAPSSQELDAPSSSSSFSLPQPHNPKEMALRRERVGQLEEQLLAAAGDDATLLSILEALIDGFDKPGDIAREKNLEIQVVYQGVRRLRRRLTTSIGQEAKHD